MQATAQIQVPKTKKQLHFAVRCAASALYMRNVTPTAAAVEVTAVETQAFRFSGYAAASKCIASLKPMFGSFAWHVVPVLA